ncbi:MAG: YicC family protein [Clostridia bacterium]|nr:YicC family protein [Clostridia bacterium]
MRSMTGYGKSELVSNGITLTVEIKTVNNRYLDLNFKYPRSFTALEDTMRKAASSKLKRGKADVYFTYKNDTLSDGAVEVDLALATEYVNASKILSDNFTDLKNDFSIYSLIKTPDVVKTSQEVIDVEALKPLVKTVIENACYELNKMREFEGAKMKADLLSRIDKIDSTVNEIAKRAPMVSENYRIRLNEKVSELLQTANIDESRILQETAVFADKCNIDEELTRLRSHVAQFRSICEGTGEIGKRLDFLVQEFNREANTVCSKSNDVTVTDNALTLKCEIEKVREQIQNIE